MSTLRVEIIRLCKTPEGWKRYPVIYRKNGKVKPAAVFVKGSGEQIFTIGRYQVRWYEGRNTRYTDVGDNPAKALALRNELSQALVLKRDGNRDAICSITVPRSLMRHIEDCAREDGVSSDNWATAVLAQMVGSMKAVKKRGASRDTKKAEFRDIQIPETDM